jgi:hypothetical protein
MFAEFDRTNFPIVKVTMNSSPESLEDFQDFLNKWTELYEEQNDFSFIFDTQSVTNPPLKYSIKMSQFIKNLRKRDYQYLQKSIILINSNKVQWMLDFIFLIQPPVAPVYIYNIHNNDLIEGNILLNNNIQKIMDHPDTSYIEPNKPFLPLF